MQDAVDPQLASGTDAAARKHRDSGGNEYLVGDGGAVHVGVGADQNGVTEGEGVIDPAAQERVLHDDDVSPEPDRAVVAIEHRTVQNPGAGTDGHIPSDHG